MTAYVRSVNAGRAVDAAWAGTVGRTAIDKRPCVGAVRVGPLGLEIDEQADHKHHGGPHQAVYAFAREDLDRWAGRLGRDLHDGQFGENLTTSGIDLNESLIGERWAVGSVLLEVADVRIPCSVFANWLDQRGWVKTFTAEARPGPYLRVLEAGEITAGDEIVVVHRPGHEVTVGLAFRARTTERHLLPRLLGVPALAPDSRLVAEKYAAGAGVVANT